MDYGYDPECFEKAVPDEFICMICQLVARDPQDCKNCGFIFCHSCISDWTSKNPTCPNRCALEIQPIKGAIRKLYGALSMRCTNQFCKKGVPIVEFGEHLRVCRPPCPIHRFCGGLLEQTYKPHCSLQCSITDAMLTLRGQPQKLYIRVDELLKHVGGGGGGAASGVLGWSKKTKSARIDVSENGLIIRLKQVPFVFRSIISECKFTSGIHYWQMLASPDTKNQAKIGVTLSPDFDYETAFCDYAFGFAYYGNGTLRNGSNSEGKPYGKKFKNDGRLGVLLDMENGTLSFGLNGEFWGIAFQSERLRKGPIWPAVSLLHEGGFDTRFELAPPAWLKK